MCWTRGWWRISSYFMDWLARPEVFTDVIMRSGESRSVSCGRMFVIKSNRAPIRARALIKATPWITQLIEGIKSWPCWIQTFCTTSLCVWEISCCSVLYCLTLTAHSYLSGDEYVWNVCFQFSGLVVVIRVIFSASSLFYWSACSESSTWHITDCNAQ